MPRDTQLLLDLSGTSLCHCSGTKIRTSRFRALPPGCPFWSRAFTLVELLVVIAIIALLAAFLLPVLSRAKAAGRKAICQGNLHQIGLALRMYVDDLGKYPPLTQWLMAENIVWDWRAELSPYTSGPAQGDGVYRCAEWVFPNKRGTYGYNDSGTGFPVISVFGAANEPLKLLGLGGDVKPGDSSTFRMQTSESQVVAPADMIAIGDKDGRDFPPPDIIWAYLTLAGVSGWPGRLHNGGGNILFCDGHVDYAMQTNWVAPTTTVRRRWNNDNQPHPETWRCGAGAIQLGRGCSLSR